MIKFIISLTMFLAVASSCTAQPQKPIGGAENSPAGMVNAYIADLPSVLDFAGETVPVEFPYVREAIEREVLTTMCMHTRTMITLRNTTRFFPIIEPILAKHGIPDDFKYLCLAESGLDVNAYSSAKAAGLWQFIPSAAKTYNIETGENVDLRYHVEKSTEAACRYLKDAKNRLGSWTMAAAAYNAGQAGVNRRATNQGVTSYWDLFLPEETMRYVPRILSFKILCSNPALYGFKLEKDDYFPPFKNFKEVTISNLKIDWAEFAAKHNTNYRMLRILNPWIRTYNYDNNGGKAYVVKIPNENFKKLGY